MLPVLLFIFFCTSSSLLLAPCRTLICTEECLLHPSRNPALGREGIEAALKEYLGLKKIIWLWKGMAGDDAITNGHVDNLACFVRPGVVALSWTDDVNDPQVTPLHCTSIHVYQHMSLPALSTSGMSSNIRLAFYVPLSR
jgi:agmatine/peptidylarginine deiminase